MELIKTIKVKIFNPTKVKTQFLGLLEENSKALNYYIQQIKKYKTTSKTKLHKLTYQDLKSKSKLKTPYLQTARDKAIETFKSFKTRKSKKELPEFRNPPIRLDNRTFSILETDNKLKYFAKITTNQTQVLVPLLGLNYQYKYIEKLLKNEFKLGSVELVKKKKEFYLHIAIKKEIEIKTPDHTSTPVGVDIGLVNLAVSVCVAPPPNPRCQWHTRMTLREGISDVKFFSGKRSQWKREFFHRVRRSLGRFKKLKKIKQLKGKESRYMRDLNHKISHLIVQQAKRVKNPVIVMENLKYIRERIQASKKMNRKLHNWNFSQLQKFIEYNANWEGIPVIYINPKNTSRTCARCGHVDKSSRKNSTFKCKRCGYEINADLNGAINIARQFFLSYMLEKKGCSESSPELAVNEGEATLVELNPSHARSRAFLR